MSGSATGTTLNGSNTITTLGNFSATGTFSLTDNANLLVTGPVSGAGVSLTIVGASHSLALNSNVNGGAGRVTLNATAGATQNAAGIITADGLELLGGAASNYTLNTATNQVNTLAGNAGAVSFKDGTALSVGTAGGSTGLLASGNVALETTVGGIALQKTLDAGSGNVSLDSFAGITEDAGASGGILKTTGSLSGSAGAAILDNANNTIASLGNFSAGNGFTLNDANGGLNLTGTVNSGSGLASITTSGGDLALANTGSVAGNGVSLTTSGAGNAISLSGNVNGNAGNVTLNSADLISQTGGFIHTTGPGPAARGLPPRLTKTTPSPSWTSSSPTGHFH